MDVRFEPIGDSPEALYAIPLPGFRAYARNEQKGYFFEYSYTILFFVIQSERGYVPTSAVIRNIVARNINTGEEYAVDGWLPIDPEPLVDFYELDFEMILKQMESQDSDSNNTDGGVQVIQPEPSLVQMIGEQMVRGSVNVPFEDMDIFMTGVFTLVEAVQSAPFAEDELEA